MFLQEHIIQQKRYPPTPLQEWLVRSEESAILTDAKKQITSNLSDIRFYRGYSIEGITFLL